MATTSGTTSSAPTGVTNTSTGTTTAGSTAAANFAANALSSGAKLYEATLAPQNNSGAHGIALASQNGSTLTVDVEATGLTPLQTHSQYITGFPNGQPSSTPTLAQDTNHDGFVSAAEAQTVTGPALLGLSTDPNSAILNPIGSTPAGPYPTADANGVVHYHESFTFPFPFSATTAAVALQNIANSGVELRGLNVAVGVDGMTHAGFDPNLPVAFGLFHQVTESSLTSLENALAHPTVG